MCRKIPLLVLAAMTLGVAESFGQITPPFTQCPAVGADTSCAILIVITDEGVSVLSDPSQGPFDTIEDTLVGVQNNSSGTIQSLPLSSPNPIFGFDADGICGISPVTGQPYSPAPPNCPYGPTTYEGPGVMFSSINATATSGIVSFAGGLGPGQSTYFSLELSIQTLCSSLNVPLTKQNQLPWGRMFYDNGDDSGTDTIAAYGCYLTSAVMLINYYAAVQGSSFSTDPGTLNGWLSGQPDGYQPANTGRLNPEAVARYAQTVGHLQMYYYGAGDPDDFVVDNFLCNGDPVILNVQTTKGHFVVATGQTMVSGTSTFSINDPYYPRTTLADYNFDYLGVRKFSSSPTFINGLVITGDSPIELLVTDPGGNETGFDPTTGQVLDQIPGSFYYKESISDDTGVGNPTPQIEVFEALEPISGSYNVEVIGTGTGTYGLEFVGYDANGNPSILSLKGTTSPGTKTAYQALYSSVPGSQIQVVSPDTIPPAITVSATPTTLWPPNGKMVPVTVSGTMTDNEPGGTGVNASTAAYAVADEYGQVQPSGGVTLGANGSYSFTVLLQASRRGDDLDGRAYMITVSAQDNAGNLGASSTVVTVPHDRRK